MANKERKVIRSYLHIAQEQRSLDSQIGWHKIALYIILFYLILFIFQRKFVSLKSYLYFCTTFQWKIKFRTE